MESLRLTIKVSRYYCGVLLAGTLALVAGAQSPHPAITLDPPTGWELQTHAFDAGGKRLPDGPANFRRLGEARAGE